MEKQRLTTLISQPTKINENDFNELLELKQEFPYFQALQPLITISSKKYAPQAEKKYLQSAAIYAFDRKHLKEVLTKDYNSVDEATDKNLHTKNKVITQERESDQNITKLEEVKPIKDSESTSNSASAPAHTSNLPESFFEQLFNEMEELKAEKENYLKTLERFEANKSEADKSDSKAKVRSATAKAKTTARSKSATTKKTTPTKKSATKTASAPKKSSAAKKPSTTKASATAKKASPKKANPAKKKAVTPSRKKTAPPRPKKDEHDIIEEITARKELKINDAHKKEQLDIINSFIENEPILTKRLNTDNQSSKQEAEDLSANSTNLSDDVVSETLAKLMIKQGRKQQAVNIYKKLIWKFPQKKTYFVEIIEELKKES